MTQPELSTFEFDVVTVDAQGHETQRTRGQAQSFTEDLGNGIGLDMVLVPGGSFVMGAPATEAESLDWERPQHPVRVKPFFVGKYPVTQAQWFAVSALPKVDCDLNPNCSKFKGLKRPAERVSWFEALEFCDRLSHCTGRAYRLLTESEWEYACRAGTTTPFHFGETITTALANYNGNYTYGAGPKRERREQTTEVDSFPANAFGLYDLHGNVQEWCLDYWQRSYEGAPTDGSVWTCTEGQLPYRRVLRGGWWDYDPQGCRSACRSWLYADHRYDSIGFRVACAAP